MLAFLAVIGFVGVVHSSATCVPQAIELSDSQSVFIQESVPSGTCGLLVSVASHHAQCACHWSYAPHLKPYVLEEDASHILLQPLGPYFSHENVTCYYIGASGTHCADFILVIKDLYPGKYDMGLAKVEQGTYCGLLCFESSAVYYTTVCTQGWEEGPGGK